MSDMNLEFALIALENYLETKSHKSLVKFWQLYPRPIPNWHVNMMNDGPRNSYYQKEIQATCRDKIVLDIGCGCGLLTQFALEAGAKHIYAIELDPVLQTCFKHTYKNEIAAGKVTFLAKNSSHLSNEDFSAGKPEVVVHEIFAANLFGEKVMETFSDLYKRDIVDTSMEFIPQTFSLMGALHNQTFESKIVNPQYSKTFWFLEDISFFGVPTFKSNFQTDKGQDLSPAFKIFFIDLKKTTETYESEVSSTASGDGNFLRLWFELHGTESDLTTDENVNDSLHWANNRYYLRYPKGEVKVVTNYKNGKILTHLKGS